MIPNRFAKQMIDLQKTTFDNMYDSMVMLYDHAEKLTLTLFEQANWIPEESSRVVTQWLEILKTGRNDYKSAMDNIFTRMDDVFAADNEARSQI